MSNIFYRHGNKIFLIFVKGSSLKTTTLPRKKEETNPFPRKWRCIPFLWKLNFSVGWRATVDVKDRFLGDEFLKILNWFLKNYYFDTDSYKKNKFKSLILFPWKRLNWCYWLFVFGRFLELEIKYLLKKKWCCHLNWKFAFLICIILKAKWNTFLYRVFYTK